MVSGQNAAAKEGPVAGQGIRHGHAANGVARIVDAAAGIIDLYMPDGIAERRKFACCGFAPSSRDLGPWDDPEWAIVGMNQLYLRIPRADLWFEIHQAYAEAVVPGTDHEAFLRDCGIPVLMTDRFPEVPTAVRFPLERLIGKFGDYYTSTVAYMLAFVIDHIDRCVERRLRQAPPNGFATAWDVGQLAWALYHEYEIGLYGIDLVADEEYGWQRPCAEYYLGQARGRGIGVRIPTPSALLRQRYRYGYELEPVDLIRDSDLEKRRIALAQEHEHHREALFKAIGQLEELAYWRELRRIRERGAGMGTGTG